MPPSESQRLRILKFNQFLRNAWRGETVHILGLGPSLKNSLNRKLIKGRIISCNSYFTRNIHENILPDAHVAIDPLYHLEPEQYLLPELRILNKIPKKIYLFLNIDAYDSITKALESSIFVRCNYVGYSLSANKYTFDVSTMMLPLAQNVIMTCITIAAYLGASRVYLHGVDHDILRLPKEKFEEDWKSPHYSEENADTIPEMGIKTKLKKFGINHNGFLKIQSTMTAQYAIIHKLCQINGIFIYNSTPNSALQEFEYSEAAFE
jgi:hypothetical protein